MNKAETENSLRKNSLMNTITFSLQQNYISQKEFDEVVEKVRELYYSDAVIKGC